MRTNKKTTLPSDRGEKLSIRTNERHVRNRINLRARVVEKREIQEIKQNKIRGQKQTHVGDRIKSVFMGGGKKNTTQGGKSMRNCINFFVCERVRAHALTRTQHTPYTHILAKKRARVEDMDAHKGTP